MNVFGGLLADVEPSYEVPIDDLVGDVLIPAFSNADEVRVASAYFTSESIAQLAPGLAGYLNGTQAPLRLLLSPVLTQQDQEAVRLGTSNPREIVERIGPQLISDGLISVSSVARHAVECLAYLVAANRLQVRFVLMDAGQYHKKIWLMRSGSDWLGVHGSGNVTGRGLLENGEQMTVDRDWADGERAARRVQLLNERWEQTWEGKSPNGITVEADAAMAVLKDLSTSRAPTSVDFWTAWKQDAGAGLAPPLPLSRAGEDGLHTAGTHRLAVPKWLNWREGAYAHQGQAIDALEANNYRGILAIATGGGKTKTSLIAATEIQNQQAEPLLVVVVVPTSPLERQWAADVRDFGIDPVRLSQYPRDKRNTALATVSLALRAGKSRTEVLLMTSKLFNGDESIRDMVATLPPNIRCLFIGDEAHSLGTDTFLQNAPERFDFRIGLSATPVRQYDPDGTDRLFAYIGPQVFEFSLEDATRAGCLVPYRYLLHAVELSGDEWDEYKRLTQLIVKAGLSGDDDGRSASSNTYVERLLRQRRSVLEHAEAKLPLLAQILREYGPANVARTLVYSSAKETPTGRERQITEVNRLMSSLGVISHQFTSDETSTPANAARILEKFAAGDYQVLTAMKVLDEGVDVPQTDTAFLIASSAVRREWVQRRGRVLRSSPGKRSATIHDFLVVPPSMEDETARKLVRNEISRAEEFASLAINEWDSDGPRLNAMKQYDL